MTATRRDGLLLVTLSLAACGGRQAAAPAPEPPVEYPCCLDDRWEQPPPEIGQTPPDRPAPDDALDAFDPE